VNIQIGKKIIWMIISMIPHASLLLKSGSIGF